MELPSLNSETKTGFRLLLLLVLFMELLPFGVPILQTEIPTIPDAEITKLTPSSIEAYRDLQFRFVCCGAATVTCQLIAVVGLWFFWSAARELFALSLVLLWAISGSSPVVFSGSWINILYQDVFFLAYVVVILLTYIGPVRQRLLGLGNKNSL